MARSETEINDRIAELEQLLESGVSTIMTDGTQTVFDTRSARKELRKLKALTTAGQANRPASARIKLNF